MKKQSEKQFIVFKKKSKSSENTFFYIMTVNPVTKKTITRSTGCTDKADALIAAQKMYDNGNLFISSRTGEKSVKFDSFAALWWTSDCSYVQSELARGKVLTETYLRSNRLMMENHIVPYFENFRLQDIRADDIQNWMIFLSQKKGLSVKTIKNLRSILSTMLKDARMKRLINENPCDFIKPSIVHSQGHGRPTKEEIVRVFSSLENWNNNLLLMLANYVSSLTGLRNGEIRALRWNDLLQKENCIVVNHNYTSHSGLKKPKSGKVRVVALPVKLWKYLTATPGYPESFVFSYDGKRPVGAQTLERSFCNAFCKIGVSKRDQILRRLTFHSWRVNANSLLLENSTLSPMQLRSVIGHESDDMTQLYYKQSDDVLERARRAIEENQSIKNLENLAFLHAK